jgi:hypothetical protein
VTLAAWFAACGGRRDLLRLSNDGWIVLILRGKRVMIRRAILLVMGLSTFGFVGADEGA